MIKNENQHRITRNLAAELNAVLLTLNDNDEFTKLSPVMQKAYTSSLRRQLAQFEEEISDYENLRSGHFDFDYCPNIDELPVWLIKARIACNLRQEDLAKLLKLKKQQIQQYEATEYEFASLHRLREVLSVLRSYKDSQTRRKNMVRSSRDRRD